MPKNALQGTFADDDDDLPDEPEAGAPAEGDEQPAAAAGEETRVVPEPARTPLSRRRRAAEAQAQIAAELKALREDTAKERETYRERLDRMSQENAELRGTVQGYMAQPRQEQRREEPPAAADPEKLLQEAYVALDARDMHGYHRKLLDAGKAAALREVAPRFEEMRQQRQPAAGPQLDPVFQAIVGQYADVAYNPKALQVAQAHDRILDARGLANGPERWKQAMEEGRRFLGAGTKPTPGYSQRSREVLSGVPTGRAPAGGGTGGGEPGVTLSEAEKTAAKKSGMSFAEYAKELVAMHPERLEQ